MNEYKVGDVVVLRCGGPKMVVTEIHGEIVRVVWTDDNQQLESAVLNEACFGILEKETK